MSSPNYLPVREEWLQRHREDVLEPDLAIVDAHHHFYDRPGWCYLIDEYGADARAGHRVRASVYMQALTRYRASGPEAMKPVGETEYVAEVTEGSVPRIAAGIVGYGVVVLFVQFGARCTKKALHDRHLRFLWLWELRAFRADWCTSPSGPLPGPHLAGWSRNRLRQTSSLRARNSSLNYQPSNAATMRPSSSQAISRPSGSLSTPPRRIR